MDLQDAALWTASRLGLVEETARIYDNLIGIPELPQIDSEISSYTSNVNKRGEVLLPLIYGRGGLNTYIDCLLAHAFRIRGYEPTLLLCNADLEMCYPKKWAPDETTACELCHFYGENLLDRFGLEYQYFNDIDTSSNTCIEGETYRGVNVESHALAYTRAYLQKYHIDRKDEYEQKLLDRFERSARILTDVAHHMLDNNNFDAVVSNNPSYIIGGSFLETAEMYDVPGWSVGVGYKPQSLLLGNQSNRSALSTYENNQTVKDRLSTPLTDDEYKKIDKYMNNRMDGEEVLFDHSKLGDESFSSERGEKIYGAFTNLLWDASLTADDTRAFEDVFEWIKTSISYFRDHPSQKLYIKTHPAETLRGTNESISSWIDHNISVPKNVTILNPDTKVNPYDFMMEVDTGIVWNSTAGLEMSYLGTPTIVAGSTHYRGFDFTYDASNSAEYISFLSSDVELDNEMRSRAKRYAHLLFIERHIEFPFFESTDGNFRFLPVNHKELTLGNTHVDLLVEAIITDTPVPEIKKS